MSKLKQTRVFLGSTARLHQPKVSFEIRPKMLKSAFGIKIWTYRRNRHVWNRATRVYWKQLSVTPPPPIYSQLVTASVLTKSYTNVFSNFVFGLYSWRAFSKSYNTHANHCQQTSSYLRPPVNRLFCWASQSIFMETATDKANYRRYQCVRVI